MKTIRVYLLPMMLTLAMCLASCSNDYEIWDDVNETETWEFELRNIMSDLDFLFENSNVKFLHAEELNCSTVDSTDFINNEAFYPVCMKKIYNIFMLGKLSFIKNDTTSIHMPLPAIQGMVSNVINNKEKYDFVKLFWDFNGNTFTTIAVFEKNKGNIVYDNILTNIPLFQTDIPSKKSKLTRCEPGNGPTEIFVTRIFYKDIMPITFDSYTFELWVKCLCKVKWIDFSYYVNPQFDSIVYKVDYPQYPQQIYNLKADASSRNNTFAYYIWVGKETDYFPYISDDNFEVCFSVARDARSHPKVNYGNDIKYDGYYGNILTIMNMNLFEPNPSSGDWGF